MMRSVKIPMATRFAPLVMLVVLSGCGIYSFTGIDDSGAETFAVDYLRTQTPLASETFAQRLTEGMKDLVLQRSALDVVADNADLTYSGFITAYEVRPVSNQSDETAALNRLTVTLRISYINDKEPEKSFDNRTFSEFVDFDANLDFATVETTLWDELLDKLTQSVFNASLGNW